MTGAGPDGHIIGELRRKIEQDRERLASLNSGSPAYRRLRRQVIRGSARLRALERDVELRADQVIVVRLLFVVIGAVIVLAGWGSWKLLIGVGVAAFGVLIADRLPDHLYRTGLGFNRRAG